MRTIKTYSKGAPFYIAFSSRNVAPQFAPFRQAHLSEVSVGAEFRERFADPEIQAGRDVHLPDRHGGREGAEPQRYQRRRQRHARALLAGRYGRGSEDKPYV